MNNSEYIKSLEQRIAALEEQLAKITVIKGEGVELHDCSIQALALQGCKNVSVEGCTVEGLGGFFAHCSVSGNTVHNLDAGKSKLRLKNCTVHNINKN